MGDVWVSEDGTNYAGKVVGDVWVSEDGSEDGTKWQQVPLLPTPCQQPAVINIGRPEYLVAIGILCNLKH